MTSATSSWTLTRSPAMIEFPKTFNLFKRDSSHRMIYGQWSRPEYEALCNIPWVFTEKVDGMNMRVGIDEKGSVFVHGRTNNALIPGGLLEYIEEKGVKATLSELWAALSCRSITLYGEGYGPKIQQGDKYGDRQRLVFFDAMVDGTWLTHAAAKRIVGQLGLDFVPTVAVGNLFDGFNLVRSGEFTSAWGDFLAEGVIGRPELPLYLVDGTRVACKIKHCDTSKMEPI